MKRAIIPVLLLVALLLCGCTGHQAEIASIEDMKDQALTIAAPDDIDANSSILEICPKATIQPMSDLMYGVRSVSEGKLDAYIDAQTYIEKAIRECDIRNVRILDKPLLSYDCGLGLSSRCSVPGFEDAVNKTLESLISDGTIDEMYQRWFIDQNDVIPEIKLDDAPEYVLNAVTYGQCKPYSFFKNGELTGFDVELLYRVCEQNHWGVKLTNAEYTSMLMGLSTGKYDIISADLFITEDRGENIIFSIPFRTEKVSIAVRSAAAPDDVQKPEYSSLSELEKAKKFSVLTGSVFDKIVEEYYPQGEVVYYQSAVDAALAVANGKADAAVFDAPSLAYIASCTEGVELLPEYLAKDDYHLVMSKSDRGEALQKEFNEWLAAYKQSGELDKLYEFWCSNEEPEHILDFSALPDTNGKITVVSDAAGRPDVYYYNNNLAGFPIELIYNFCRDRGYGAEASVISFDGMIPTLVSGKADIMVALLSYTEERAENVLFTDCIAEGGVGVLVRTVNADGGGSLLDTLKDRLYKTFVVEARWRLVVSGLGMTALITLSGFLLANILGVGFCACTMSKRRGLRIFADVYDRIMQGTPMVVILMILYYVIFGKTDISGSWVAIIAFGMASGASLARQFYGAISGVDVGQIEAALALGFTRPKAFMGIVFPQAARTALPGYFSEIIGLMKGTAIVGYISVIDLTKAGDLIRSSTYDAFFPLLSAALIYFLISFGILSLLKRIQKKLEPKRYVAQEVQK